MSNSIDELLVGFGTHLEGLLRIQYHQVPIIVDLVRAEIPNIPKLEHTMESDELAEVFLTYIKTLESRYVKNDEYIDIPVHLPLFLGFFRDYLKAEFSDIYDTVYGIMETSRAEIPRRNHKPRAQNRPISDNTFQYHNLVAKENMIGVGRVHDNIMASESKKKK